MANVEGDSPNSDELRGSGEEPAAESKAAPTDQPVAEPTAEEAAAAPPAAETTSPEGEPAEAAEAKEPAEEEATEPAEGEEEKKEEEGEEEEEEPSKLPLYLEIAGLIVIPLVLLAMAGKDLLGEGHGWNVFSIWTAVYIIMLGLIPYALWKSRETSTLYTVFLGLVVAAMLTGVYCLWLEMVVKYRGDINAQEAKRKVGMSQPMDNYRLIAGRDGVSRGLS